MSRPALIAMSLGAFSVFWAETGVVATRAAARRKKKHLYLNMAFAPEREERIIFKKILWGRIREIQSLFPNPFDVEPTGTCFNYQEYVFR